MLAIWSLSACSATAPDSEASASPSPSPSEVTASEISLDGEILTGTGGMASAATIPIPSGDFHSLTLDVECTGEGFFEIQIEGFDDETFSTMGGDCGGAASRVWPLTSTDSLRVTMATAEASTWSIAPRFSTAEFVVDEDIAADCAAFGPLYSAIFNADIGYTDYADFDDAEWNRRIDAAAVSVAALVKTATPSLGTSLTVIAAGLQSPDRVVGDAQRSVASEIYAISTTCSANQTRLEITPDYGG